MFWRNFDARERRSSAFSRTRINCLKIRAASFITPRPIVLSPRPVDTCCIRPNQDFPFSSINYPNNPTRNRVRNYISIPFTRDAFSSPFLCVPLTQNLRQEMAHEGKMCQSEGGGGRGEIEKVATILETLTIIQHTCYY